MKKTLCAILILALALSLAGAALADEPLKPGQKMPDFTVQTADGKSFTLSEALAGKNMVLIDLWATWCESCKTTFPALQKAWEGYGDRVAVIALSIEANDTDEKMLDFARAHGLTFPVARDTAQIAKAFDVHSVPTTIAVDRFGNVAMLESGIHTAAEDYTRLFDRLLSADYTETKPLESFPEATAATVEWTLVFTDAEGKPVPGVAANFCTDTSCTLLFSGDDGCIVHTSEPQAYHIQVLRVPSRYAMPANADFTADANGGRYTFALANAK